jgi:hypothetical protein
MWKHGCAVLGMCERTSKFGKRISPLVLRLCFQLGSIEELLALMNGSLRF